MAHLLAQPTVPASPAVALPHLHRAALLSTHPAYIYALKAGNEEPLGHLAVLC